MDAIERLGAALRLVGVGPARVAGRATGGTFHLALGEPAAEAAEVAATPALVGLLAVQEAESDAARNRAARRRGRELLEALSALQRAVLEGGADPAGLARLATLAEDTPAAADPALGEVVHAIVLRARVELARYAPS
jgi:protein-disulfide isomerase-like protein with CxxC motif